jgi:hypothetical protein
VTLRHRQIGNVDHPDAFTGRRDDPPDGGRKTMAGG